jgi:TonB-linked SusC/RagA family outer membrane protein
MKNNSPDEFFFPKRKLKKLILIMRLSALFLMVLSLNLSASVYSQNTKFTVDLNGKTVREVFQILEQQSEFRFFYNDDFSYIDNVVDMDVKNENVEQILAKLFETSDITYKVFDNNLVVLTLKQNLQQVTISGTVLDGTNNEPLPGANVQVKGTTRGTTTDLNGKYTVEASKGDVLVYSFIGYLPEEVTVGEETKVDVTLMADIQSLEEVVVVGYGTQRRTEVTGAITSVSSEKLTAIPTGTLDQALQGRAAGVTVINNGSPGTAATMRIRGIGTVNNADPLYVVDGVVSASINGLNANDIESMQILKDASTTAIYGSQGSNGVIMITTKKGKVGKTTVDFDAYAGVQYNNKRYDLLNNEQYIAYATDAFGGAPAFSDGNYALRIQGIGPDRPEGGETNWQDEIMQSGMMQSYNLAVAGGGENSSFRFSAGHLGQEGVIIKTGLERYNLRVNSDFKLGRLKIGENIGLSFSKQDPLADSGGRSLIEHAIKSAPYLPVYNHLNKGGYQGPSTPIDGQDAENPVRIMRLNDYDINTTSIIGDLYAELELFEGLKYKSLVGFENIRTDDDQFFPSFDDDDIAGGITHSRTWSITRRNKASYQSTIFTNSLNYTKTFAEKHNVEVLALMEYGRIDSRTYNISSENDISDETRELGNLNNATGSNFSEYGRIGYLGRLNYNYDQKYLVAASIRKDASSRFGTNNRWGTFPSVALGWNIAKESFMQNVAAVSNLKLRGSWGKAGNDKIGNYAYAPTLTSDMYYTFGNGAAVAGTTPSGTANADLKWEETTMTNIGLDLGLLNNQFTLAFEYYINKSDDLLMNVPSTNSLGTFSGVIPKNAGSVETRGIELQLGYNDFEGAFQWSANLNLGTFKNEVKSLGGAAFLEGFNFEGNNLTRCTVGEPAFYFYGYTMDGIFQTNDEARNYMGGTQYAGAAAFAGDFRIKDIAGPVDPLTGEHTGPDGVIDATNDRGNIGNPFPKMTLGFDLNASYKGLDLNIFISGVYGNDIYNTNKFDLEGMPRLFNAGTETLDRWTTTNPSTTMPRPGTVANNLSASTRYVEDGSYTKLKNVTLGYTVPTSLLKNKISKVRIYISAQNMVTITNYSGLDPEVGANTVVGAGIAAIGAPSNNFANGIDVGAYPIPKSVIAGIQLSF